MKLKRILAVLLMLTMALSVLPLNAFAAIEVPGISDVAAKLTDANEGVVYDSSFDGAGVKPPTSTGRDVTSSLTDAGATTSSLTGWTGINDDWAGTSSCQNIFANSSSLVLRSHSDTFTKSSADNDNYLVVCTGSSVPAGAGFIIAFDVTSYHDSFTRGIDFVACSGYASSDIFSWYLCITKDGVIRCGSNELGNISKGQTLSIAVQVRIIAPNAELEGDKGSILYDVYLDGKLAAEGLRFVSEEDQAKIKSGSTVTGLSTDYKVSYTQSMRANGDIKPAGVNDGTEYGADIISLDSFRFYYSDECYETVHGTEPCSYETENAVKLDGSTHAFLCECGKLGAQEAHTDNEFGICSLCEADIFGVSLSIDSDLSIKYYTEIKDTALLDGGTLSMKFTTPTAERTITAYTEADGKYVFEFDGIGPHQVGVSVKAELMIGDTVIDCKIYSVEEYCREALALYPEKKALVSLINNLLIYAQNADKFSGGKDTSDIAKDLALTGSTATPSSADDKMTVSGNSGKELYVRAAGVNFDYSNRIYFKIYSANGSFTAEINGSPVSYEPIGDGVYIVYTDRISPVDYDKVYTLSVSADDIAVSVSYSVNTYAYYMSIGDDAAMADLATALYRYGCAAVAYITPSISYALNGGNNPENAPTVYDPKADTPLPIPERDGYAFGGWYTTPAFDVGTRVEKIAQGSVGGVEVYAKWNIIFVNEDFTSVTVDHGESSKTHGYVTYNGYTKTGSYYKTEEDISGKRYLLWTVGESDSLLTVNNSENNVSTMSSTAVSYTFALSKHGEASLPHFEFRLRGAGTDIYFGYFVNGDFRLGSKNGPVVATVTEEVTYVRIVIDFAAGTISGYDEYGNVINSIAAPEVEKEALNSYLLYTRRIDKNGAPAGQAIRYYGIKIEEGNAFEA